MQTIKNKWNNLRPRTQGVVYLLIAIVLELTGDYFLPYTKGCTVPGYMLLCAVLFFVCFVSYAKALVTFDLGIGYALWSGIGIIFLTIVAVAVFGQSLNAMDIVGIILIIIGIVIMNVFTGEEKN